MQLRRVERKGQQESLARILWVMQFIDFSVLVTFRQWLHLSSEVTVGRSR